MNGFIKQTAGRRRRIAMGVGAITLVLVACGVKSIAPQWNTDIVVAGANLTSPPTTATRELVDGRLRVVYQYDAQTLVADTYNIAGELQDHREFPHPATNPLSVYHQPLFLTDDVAIWIGEAYEQSVRLDLADDSLTLLPALDGILPADTRFFAAQSLLLEDGTIILAGRDIEANGNSPAGRARMVALASDGSVQTLAVDSSYHFKNLIPIEGTTHYLVTLTTSDQGNMRTIVYEGEGATLIERTDLTTRAFSPQLADASGVWGGARSGLSTALSHAGPTSALTWELPGQHALEVVPTSAGDYLVQRMQSDGKAFLSRMTAEGAILWDVNLATGPGYPGSSVTESNGRILLTESSYELTDGVRVDVQDGTEQTLITSTIKNKVWHRLLDMNGRELTRFAEPAYRGVFIKDVENLALGDLLEYSAGSCDPDYAVPLNSGDFVSVSKWCAETRTNERNRKLFYFNVP